MVFMATHQNWCIFSKSNGLKGKIIFGCLSLGLCLLFSQIDARVIKKKKVLTMVNQQKNKMGVKYRRRSLDWGGGKLSQHNYKIMNKQATVRDLH